MMELNPWLGRLAVFASLLAFVVIRWPHGIRYKSFQVVDNRKGGLEIALLAGAAAGTTFIPLLWIATPLFAFADYTLYAVPYVTGLLLMVLGLYLFHRSHNDLGMNWSVTVQIRDDHSLVTDGVYSRIRHPMYASMFLLGAAQALSCPNWIVGPAYLVSFGLLYICRVHAGEQMMADQFGEQYEQYKRKTGRVTPKLWQALQREP